MENKDALIAYIALIFAVLLWGGSFIAFKIAFRAYGPMVVLFGRMAVASFCFLFLLGRIPYRSFKRSHIKALLFMSFCEPCMYFLFEANALKYTSAAQAGIIVAILPLMTAVAAFVILKERTSRKSLIGFFIAIFGAVWLSLSAEATESAPFPILGNFLEFMAMVCAVGYFVTLKRLTAFLSPLFLTASQSLIGCLFFLPFLFLPSTTFPDRFDPAATAAVVYLGAFVTMGAYGLYNFGVSRVPVSQASAFVNVIPVCTIFLGWLILGETLNLQQCIAAVLILAGVFISQDYGFRPKPASAPHVGVKG